VAELVAVRGRDCKRAVSPCDIHPPVILVERRAVVGCDGCVVTQALSDGSDFDGRGEEGLSPIREFRRGEEKHVGRVMKDGVDKQPFSISERQRKPLCWRFLWRRPCRGPRADEAKVNISIDSIVGHADS